MAMTDMGDNMVTTGAGDNMVMTGSGDDIVITGAGDNMVMTGTSNDMAMASVGDDRNMASEADAISSRINSLVADLSLLPPTDACMAVLNRLTLLPSPEPSEWVMQAEIKLYHLRWLRHPDPSHAEVLQKVLDVTLEEAMLVQGTTTADARRLCLSRSCHF